MLLLLTRQTWYSPAHQSEQEAQPKLGCRSKQQIEDVMERPVEEQDRGHDRHQPDSHFRRTLSPRFWRKPASIGTSFELSKQRGNPFASQTRYPGRSTDPHPPPERGRGIGNAAERPRGCGPRRV